MVIFQYNLYILGSTFKPCYIQNRVIMNRVIKRLKCIKVFTKRFYILTNVFYKFSSFPPLNSFEMFLHLSTFNPLSPVDQNKYMYCANSVDSDGRACNEPSH